MNSQSTGNSPGPICCSGKRRRRGPWAVVVVCLVALSPAMGAAADPAGGEAWEALPSHGADADPVVPRRLRDEISRASASAAGRGGMAARLAAVLQAPDLTPEAALFVCRELARVGDDTSLPALVPWLRSGDTRRVDLARTALEGIGTAAARQALREALPHSEGNARLGIVRSIGVLRDVQAVPALDGMREAADPVLQEAVLLALAEIGTPAAAAAVRRAGPPAAADRARTDALLLAAQRLFAGGHGEAAGEICAELWEAPLDRRDRAAALQGMARSRHPATAAALRQAIDDRNATLAGTAAGLLRIVDMPEVLAGIVADLDALTPVAQTRVLEVLGERGAREYAGAAAEWLSAADEGVRGAAIRALGAIG
ncbi:MAG: hypothetical protein JXR77_06865, partial [Lentisphaeria bacterium]|nr:hypothetical protein [Lentisphaeria bacterium]